jgi:hypothetical protein
MKNEWLIPILKELEKKRFHGKVILNIHAGDINSIEKQERINKPIENTALCSLKTENSK